MAVVPFGFLLKPIKQGHPPNTSWQKEAVVIGAVGVVRKGGEAAFQTTQTGSMATWAGGLHPFAEMTPVYFYIDIYIYKHSFVC